MATVSPPKAAPATLARAAGTALIRALPAAAAIIGVAGVLRLLYGPSYLNYDARYALLWAGDVWRGLRPDYTAPFAPTPHPLSTAVSSLALPFGQAGDQLIVALVLLSFGALGWLLYRLGAELYSAPVGAVAAIVVLTRPALQRDALLAYQDVPFAALVVAAVLLEARHPRRGAPVLGVLALAGLMRPEAWVLAGLYLAYVWRAVPGRRRVALVALAAVAPLVWAATDWLVTGDPLHSLHGTAALAEQAGRRREITQVPRWTAQYFAFTLREPLIIGVPVGLGFAWLYRRHRSALPLAVVAVMTAVFAIGPLFGLPLIGRYVRTPAALLALFYGFAPRQVGILQGLERRVDGDAALYGDLRLVARSPLVRRAFAACAPLTTADHRPVPNLRYWLDAPPGAVRTVESDASRASGLFLAPRRVPLVTRVYGANFPTARAPASYRPLYSNRSWRVDAAPRCLTGPRA